MRARLAAILLIIATALIIADGYVTPYQTCNKGMAAFTREGTVDFTPLSDANKHNWQFNYLNPLQLPINDEGLE